MSELSKRIDRLLLIDVALVLAAIVIIIAGNCTNVSEIQQSEEVSDRMATQEEIDYWTKPKVEEVQVRINDGLYPPINPFVGTYKFGNYACKYYSSRVLRHYRIGEWDCEHHFWKDKDGYFVVALCDKHAVDEERVIEICDGIYGKVYDFCETPGVIDIYTDF